MIAVEDRLPHDQAVWRDNPLKAALGQAWEVSVDYGSHIVETNVVEANWAEVVRWRFGWPPA